MANQWLRLWHDMPTDPKWRTIARVSGERIGDVMAVYMHLLVCASANATERGRTQSFNCEDVATALDIETEQVAKIVDAMQGRVLNGDSVAGWEKRQVAREDGAAERAKAWREAKKGQNQTQANATERTQTPDKDKSRKEKEMSVQETDEVAPQAVEQPGFVSVWTAWPKSDRKGGRTVCHKLWKRAGCERHAAAILAHVECMKATTEWTRDGGQYIPAFATYLRGQRWDGAEVDQRQASMVGDV